MHNISYIWNKCMYMTVDKINKTCLNNILRQGKKVDITCHNHTKPDICSDEVHYNVSIISISMKGRTHKQHICH